MKPSVVSIDQQTHALYLDNPTQISEALSELNQHGFPYETCYQCNHSLSVIVTNPYNKRSLRFTSGDVLIWNQYIVDVISLKDLPVEKQAMFKL